MLLLAGERARVIDLLFKHTFKPCIKPRCLKSIHTRLDILEIVVQVVQIE